MGQNPSEEELLKMIKSVDVNGDNEIDFDEFLMLSSNQKNASLEETSDPHSTLGDAFKLFDKDGSGSISREELGLLMKHLLKKELPKWELDAMMAAVDVDGSGEIDFEEFKTAMEKL